MLIQQSLFEDYDGSILNEKIDTIKIIANHTVNNDAYYLLISISDCYGRMKIKEKELPITDMQKVILYGSSQHNYYSKAMSINEFKENKELIHLNQLELRKILTDLNELESLNY